MQHDKYNAEPVVLFSIGAKSLAVDAATVLQQKQQNKWKWFIVVQHAQLRCRACRTAANAVPFLLFFSLTCRFYVGRLILFDLITPPSILNN